ncbi:hypothetical protein ACFYWD_36325 [Streptomyces sp. NPDC003781]|uniref:hypothetical protein n=1 Tax=Streptomyces sp. NPDC003781 TaxID=3364686 RepID=UPI00368224F1
MTGSDTDSVTGRPGHCGGGGVPGGERPQRGEVLGVTGRVDAWAALVSVIEHG